MQKLFSIFLGVLTLSFLCLSLNAKSTNLSSSVFFNITSDLSEKLVADKDFQEFSISIYSFINKVKEAKSGTLFQKMVLGSASNDEMGQLAKSLSYTSKEELKDFFFKLFSLQKKVQANFPELISSQETRTSIELAALSVINAKLKPMHNTSDCWLAWTALIAACNAGCAYFEGDQYSTCMWTCHGTASASAGWCFITAD